MDGQQPEGRTPDMRGAAPPPAGGANGPARTPGARRRRQLKRSAKRAITLLVALVVLLGLAGIITALINGWQRRGGDASTSQQAASQPLVPDGSGAADAPQGAALLTWSFVGPVQQDVETMSILRPTTEVIALPENGRIDLAYFGNVVFVGDSITQGLQQFGHIPNAQYCAYVGAGPKEIYDGTLRTRLDGEQEVPMEALVSYQPDNVYIMLGTNAMMSLSDEALLAYYSEMLDVMRQRLGDEVGIYIQAIPPVVQGMDSRFDLARIQGLNEALAQLAFEKNMYFVNVYQTLAGEDGWLPTEYGSAADGYHLTGAGYAAWVEYLVTHTAYRPEHELYYLEGSPCYQATP